MGDIKSRNTGKVVEFLNKQREVLSNYFTNAPLTVTGAIQEDFGFIEDNQDYVYSRSNYQKFLFDFISIPLTDLLLEDKTINRYKDWILVIKAPNYKALNDFIRENMYGKSDSSLAYQVMVAVTLNTYLNLKYNHIGVESDIRMIRERTNMLRYQNLDIDGSYFIAKIINVPDVYIRINMLSAVNPYIVTSGGNINV